MSSGIKIEGLDSLMEFVEEMELTEAKQKRALKQGLEIVAKEAIKNAPVDTGAQRKSIKTKIKKGSIDGLEGMVIINNYKAIFTELGTSKDKSNAGWFTRAVESTKDKFIKELGKAIREGGI